MGYEYKKLSSEPSAETDYEKNDRIQSYILWRRLQQCNAKLANVSEFASLMSFFAVLAAVELKLEIGEASTELIIALAVTTSLLVAVTMIVKTVTCSIVPFLESVVHVLDVSRSPHEEMISLINGTWLVGNIVCPCLFILDLVIMTWIKFKNLAIEAVYAATALLTPLLISILIFGLIYYRQSIKPREEEFALLQDALERLKESELAGLNQIRKFSDTDSDQTLSCVSFRSDTDSSRTSASRPNSESSLLLKYPESSNIYGAMLTSDPMLYFGFSEY